MPSENRIALKTGVTLPYVVQGDPGGPPVVLLHGFASTWRTFGPVLPHLPDALRVYALTQRYFPGATLPPEPFQLADLAADLAAFMEALGLADAVVVGHSMGSAVAQRFAVDHPRRTRGLVLVGAHLESPGDPAVRAFWESTASHLEDPLDPEFVRAFVDSTLTQPVPEDVYETELADALAVPARVWRETFQHRLEMDLASVVGQIRAPTLIIWGDQDARASRGEQDALVAAIPDARLTVYEGAGHSVQLEAPARLAADLTAFVQGLAR